MLKDLPENTEPVEAELWLEAPARASGLPAEKGDQGSKKKEGETYHQSVYLTLS